MPSRLMHSMEPMDFMSHRMSPHSGSSVGQNLDLSSVSSKRQRVDGGGAGVHSVTTSSGGSAGGATTGGYDHSAVNFFSMDTPSLVVSKAEYEVVKQEVMSVKRALSELRSNISSEIDLLKNENRQLKTQVAHCDCRHRRGNGGGGASGSGTAKASQAASRNRGNQSSDKSSGEESDLQTSFDKALDDDDDSPSLRAYVEILERENKSYNQRINELEKQLHRVRAAVNSRIPPIDAGHASGGSDGTLPLEGGGGEAQKFSATGGFDASMFGAGGSGPSCSLYGLGMMPEAFDVEKGLQVQLLPNYNVWVSKSKLQFILKESGTLKDGSAPLFVLRRLIPLVFSWEELAASRGQGLNCKSTDDVLTKDPLDPMKVLVSKAYMRKYCLETGQPEPSEKSINETFSHQVNYARRKNKRYKAPENTSALLGAGAGGNISVDDGRNDEDNYNQQTHCQD